jgi:hypothetical protein
MPIIPALRKLRQEDYKFEVRLGYLSRPCPRNKTKQTTTTTKISHIVL